MCISHSVTEGQWHNNPQPALLLFTTAQKGWNQLPTHVIVEAAKALGGPLKSATPAPRTARETTQLPKETQKNGDTNSRCYNSNHTASRKSDERMRMNGLTREMISSQPVMRHCYNHHCIVSINFLTATEEIKLVSARTGADTDGRLSPFHTSFPIPSWSGNTQCLWRLRLSAL